MVRIDKLCDIVTCLLADTALLASMSILLPSSTNGKCSGSRGLYKLNIIKYIYAKVPETIIQISNMDTHWHNTRIKCLQTYLAWMRNSSLHESSDLKETAFVTSNASTQQSAPLKKRENTQLSMEN